MKIGICDDSKTDRERLRGLLEEYGQQEHQQLEYTEYESGVALCKDAEMLKSYDLVFLDINMDDMDGLKTAKQIKEVCPNLHIILVTAYMNYALDGYKVKASRFLLKDDLEQTIYECMKDMQKEIGQKAQVVCFPFVEGKISLRADEIIYIETSRHKNLFYTKNQTYSIYKKLDDIEVILKGMGFVRIHQSFLVNMNYIEKISSYIMTLNNGKEISVPKSRYPYVKKQYTLFKGAE